MTAFSGTGTRLRGLFSSENAAICRVCSWGRGRRGSCFSRVLRRHRGKDPPTRLHHTINRHYLCCPSGVQAFVQSEQQPLRSVFACQSAPSVLRALTLADAPIALRTKPTPCRSCDKAAPTPTHTADWRSNATLLRQCVVSKSSAADEVLAATGARRMRMEALSGGWQQPVVPASTKHRCKWRYFSLTKNEENVTYCEGHRVHSAATKLVCCWGEPQNISRPVATPSLHGLHIGPVGLACTGQLRPMCEGPVGAPSLSVPGRSLGHSVDHAPWSDRNSK